jgi:effector-binding domain-containing protein
MKLLNRILIALAVIVLVLAGLGFLLPKTRHIERSITIDSPPCVVFARVNGFASFDDWSPFFAMMPDARYASTGPEFGVGSAMTWTRTGAEPETGSQTIVASTPYERVDVALDLGSQGDAQSAYLLEASDSGTRLTWTFEVDYGLNIIRRYQGLLLDGQIGPLYLQGLANLKRICEALPKVDWSDIEIGITEVPSTTIAYVSGSSAGTSEEIASALAEAYGRVVGFVTSNGLQLTGQPLAITNYRDERGWSFDAGLPVSGSPERGAGVGSPVRMGETYGGRVVRAVHVGPYADLPRTYEKVSAYMTVHELEANGRPWDVFVSDPGDTPEDEIETEVYFPVKGARPTSG